MDKHRITAVQWLLDAMFKPEAADTYKAFVIDDPDVLGDRVLSEMFAGLVAKGFALDFSLIRKNVFFFHRPG